MKYVDPARWPAILAAYAFGGLALGLANPLLNSVARGLGFRRDTGIGFNLFVLLPALFVGVAATYPRLTTVLSGLMIAAITWAAGYVLAFGVFGSHTIGMTLFALPGMGMIVLPPYVLLTIFATRFVQRWRHVGAPPPDCCRHCGYSLRGLTERRCPECGRAFENRGQTDEGRRQESDHVTR